MTKTVAEEIRSWTQKLEEVMNRNRSYDMEMEIENWDESDDENVPGYLNLGINYSIYGKYIPARIRYDDYDHPAEYPELDEVTVYNADTGEEIQNIPPAVEKEIEDAIWKHAESRKDDVDPPDDYDEYDYRKY